jgi:GntR family transcriptional regulator of vanillate catabolism
MAKEGDRVIRILRNLILSEELPAGERITEIATSEKLNVSRTPIRIAFRMLEQEGLLTKLSGRGYQIRQIDINEITGAIEVRGVLEGLAALQAAEKGLNENQKQEIEKCLRDGDNLFDNDIVTEEGIQHYQEINQRFHNIIVSAANNPAINTALARNDHLPFASSNAIAFDPNQLKREYQRLYFAHMQHHAIADAIINRQGARAESIMREHANATINYAKIFSENKTKEEKFRIVSSKEIIN